MVVVIGAQEDPGDLVQSLEASTTCSNASSGPLPQIIDRVVAGIHKHFAETDVTVRINTHPATTSYAHEILRAPVLQHVIPNRVITSSRSTG
jgi:hypothetical protein